MGNCASTEQTSTDNQPVKTQKTSPASENKAVTADVKAADTDVTDITKKLFDNAYTVYAFEDKPVSKETLIELTRLVQLAPTAFNCCPLRISYYLTAEGKGKVAATGMGGNVDTTKAAPAVAVLSVDKEWVEKMDILCAAYGGTAGIKGILGNNQDAIDGTGELNAKVQLGYVVMAARALGLGVGPMTGFDFAALGEVVGNPNFTPFAVVRLGYAAANPEYKRKDRLTFEQCASFDA